MGVLGCDAVLLRKLAAPVVRGLGVALGAMVVVVLGEPVAVEFLVVVVVTCVLNGREFVVVAVAVLQDTENLNETNKKSTRRERGVVR